MTLSRVVVVGGGFAGVLAAKKLERRFAVTLVDNKDYFEYTPGIPRTLVEPTHIHRVQVPYSRFLTRTTFVHGQAESIADKSVLVKGKIIPFKYLVLTPGSRYHDIFKNWEVVRTNRAEHLRAVHDTLKKSRHILIIGGGLVGVEMAAEILWKYPQKRVTIVDGNPCLLSRNSPRVQHIAMRFLKKRKVAFLFNQTVKDMQGKTVQTSSGRTLNTDLAILCTGIIANSALATAAFPAAVTARGLIKVNAHLQVQGNPKIFAGGDAADISEEKMAQTAELHGELIAHNIYCLEHKKTLKSYRPKPRLMLISLGKYDGIFIYKNLSFSGWIPALMKAMVEWWVMRRYQN